MDRNLVVVIVSCWLWQCAAADGTISVRLESYSNPTSTDITGYCCDAGPLCIYTCDNYFVICARQYGEANCSRNQETGVFSDDTLEFPTDLKKGVLNPLQFDFKGPYNGTVSVDIEVWDDDALVDDDLIAVFSTNVSVAAGNRVLNLNGTELVIHSMEKKMLLTVNVFCPAFYYGEKCQTYCYPSQNESGHYNCNPKSGAKECLPGYEGVNCDERICRPGCSIHHGSCKTHGECICENGWQGYNCTECLRKAGCKNGYCEQGNDCICEVGWRGDLCDQEITTQVGSCHSLPCQNGGKCQEAGKSLYNCTCPIGFTGKNCETELDPCYHHRNYSAVGRTPRDFIDPSGPFRNDYHLRPGWYRIVGAESGVLSNRCLPLYSCGTKYAMHVPHGHFKTENGTVDAQVCISSCLSCCHMKMDILIKFCRVLQDQFLIYKLRPPLSNEMGYCVE